jgi:hypothetical protein
MVGQKVGPEGASLVVVVVALVEEIVVCTVTDEICVLLMIEVADREMVVDC